MLLGCDTFAPDINGAAKFAERLGIGLIDRGHHVVVVAPSDTGEPRRGDEEHSGHRFPIFRLRSHKWPLHDWLRFVFPWVAKREVRRILDEVRPDVVHFQSHFIVGRALSREAVKRGIRLIATNHTMPENMIEFTGVPKFAWPVLLKWAWWDEARVLRRAEAITTPTLRAAAFLSEHTHLPDVHAISCGINASDYTPSFSPRQARIIFVGRLAHEKRVDVLLRALALLPESLGATLEVVGDGDQRPALEKLAGELGLGSRVVFSGLVSDEELPRAYTRADVLAMPSIAELQSIVTMEAMASALPVVAADAMALPHLVHDGENGYLFEPDSPADLAAKLEKLLTLPEAEFEAMKHASLRIVQAHDINRTLDTFECLYRGMPVTDPVT